MDLRETFAANLRRIRQERGFSQEELAHKTQMSRSYLSQLEKAKFHVSIKVIGKLAATLEVSPDDFLKSIGKSKYR
jgi:transcriptional regulator with XRE-family HTH domain